ncbi:maleylpyruvate isomerase family mycothiol-dependent enzyme [Nocardia testacea]|uniref:maleylpyruvate isomerase family mycothiol-dependent enzyme n=1 Tax=Nocardia testacea TaxID=248551 RepID=UPI000584EF54|nr:maleylpyruvate isomerase family mycothiol-dependent enzyme [Nocardia testacea]
MDIRGMLADERAEMTALLRELSEAEWDAPTLCTGWRVRELVAHLRYDSIPLTEYAGFTVRNRFSIDGVNNAMAAVGTRRTPAQLLAEFAAAPGSVSRWWPRLGLADLFVHQQDIRRPLGRARDIPADRLRAVLDRPDPFARPGRYTKGLQFVATDFDWVKGSGPPVRGRGEALALAMVGRPAVLDELEGEGVAELRRRCS